MSAVISLRFWRAQVPRRVFCVSVWVCVVRSVSGRWQDCHRLWHSATSHFDLSQRQRGRSQLVPSNEFASPPQTPLHHRSLSLCLTFSSASLFSLLCTCWAYDTPRLMFFAKRRHWWSPALCCWIQLRVWTLLVESWRHWKQTTPVCCKSIQVWTKYIHAARVSSSYGLIGSMEKIL